MTASMLYLLLARVHSSRCCCFCVRWYINITECKQEKDMYLSGQDNDKSLAKVNTFHGKQQGLFK